MGVAWASEAAEAAEVLQDHTVQVVAEGTAEVQLPVPEAAEGLPTVAVQDQMQAEVPAVLEEIIDSALVAVHLRVLVRAAAAVAVGTPVVRVWVQEVLVKLCGLEPAAVLQVPVVVVARVAVAVPLHSVGAATEDCMAAAAVAAAQMEPQV